MRGLAQQICTVAVVRLTYSTVEDAEGSGREGNRTRSDLINAPPEPLTTLNVDTNQ